MTRTARARHMLRVVVVGVLTAALISALTACAPGHGRLEGAGATFPTPLYQDWIHSYAVGVDDDLTIDYQSIGSGGGITQFMEGTVHWGTSERYLRDSDLDEAEQARGCPAIQVPITFGAVVIAFADDQLDGLVLDAAAISGIFRRTITNFQDAQIRQLNPDRELPDREIIPVHRSDGSGTTSVFTTWLTDEDQTWADDLGAGIEVAWPAGTVGGPGNEGVTANIAQNPGGIGYVNQSYAEVLDLPRATVVNADGNPAYPDEETVTAGLAELSIPDDFQFDILGIGGEGYPIVGTVWNFYWECGYAGDTAADLREFWRWAIEHGDEAVVELGYAPLDPELKQRVLAAIDRIGVRDAPTDGGGQ
ncbi:phosphate ABC transporter substrate-binding protein PstS [Natronosporangium hydrolyticum]|uniref:Phosphate-binding protein n=1 Tax=Natronosporangium hydrolyticum TaxID=2811111 RepID=A0A895YCD5_9ACTN|nr:phosphate ABC transporter substrate-binding protein PstS [Natronosporangium hydrolyticum]QSB15141.1 phosphate ABC transporter substrate-binding protein PstS [Natronosporangium hydrolyticum]